jgi:hypothetical protein
MTAALAWTRIVASGSELTTITGVSRRFGVRRHSLKHGGSVHDRHHHVEKHDVRARVGQPLQTCLPFAAVITR